MNATTAVTHTPGPWTAERIPADAHTDPNIHVDEDCEFWIAEARTAGHVLALVQVIPASDRTTEANARLIAAVPELLAGLRDAISSLDAIADNWGSDHIGIRELVAQTRARVQPVLAKAEGRS